MKKVRKHHLKIWPSHFAMLEIGHKTFEIRRNDRDFQQHDILVLEEYDPHTEKYTGKHVQRKVSHIIYADWGLKEGYCCMSLL